MALNVSVYRNELKLSRPETVDSTEAFFGEKWGRRHKFILFVLRYNSIMSYIILVNMI